MAAAGAAAQCVGDCNRDTRVAVGELIVGVNIALGERALADCPVFDRSGNARIEIGELLTAVNAALNGCPTPTPTPTNTPTPTPNLPPVVEELPIYRTFPGFPIDLPLPITDPEGSALICESMDLPPGAEIDAATDALRWTPGVDQLGPFYVPFECTDPGALRAEGEIVIQVSPLDQCAVLDCDPATGCTTELPDLTPCCSALPTIGVPEPDADCPEGLIMAVGRNTDGSFGKLRNCDFLRMFVQSQSGATLRFNVEMRCLRTSTPLMIHTRLETASRGAFINDSRSGVFFRLRTDGFFERLAHQVEIPGAPFFDLEDVEANLHVTIEDADHQTVTQSLRVILTSTPLPELPDAAPTPTVSGKFD